MPRPVADLLLSATLAVALSACAAPGGTSGGASSAGDPSPTGEAGGSGQAEAEVPSAPGWQLVPTRGAVQVLEGVNSASPPPHLLAAGESRGAPLLVDVTDGVAREISGELPDRYGRGLTALSTDGLTIAVSEQAPVGSREPATLWVGDEETTYDTEVPRDRQGRGPGWLWPLLDGEEDLRAVGAVWADGRWLLRAWQRWEVWEALDVGDRLVAREASTPQELLTGTTETTVVVAGPVAETAGTGTAGTGTAGTGTVGAGTAGDGAAGAETGAPQLWSIGDEPELTGGRWERHDLVPAPDAVTDIADWDLGWWLAGHGGLRPVVYDFGGGGGATLPVPETLLDAAHPAVHVAGIPIAGPLVLATQSVEGPTVWVAEGSGWVRVPGPAGRLGGAEQVGDGVYLLVDGRVWFRRLPELAGAGDAGAPPVVGAVAGGS